MKFFALLVQLHEYRVKREALIRLRAMSERQLVDCGISPELLKDGIKAWPWRELPENLVPLVFDQTQSDQPLPTVNEEYKMSAGDEVLVQHDAA